VGADNFEAFFEPVNFFLGILQRIPNIEDFVVDLVHAVSEGAYVCVKIKIGVAIFTFRFVVELLSEHCVFHPSEDLVGIDREEWRQGKFESRGLR